MMIANLAGRATKLLRILGRRRYRAALMNWVAASVEHEQLLLSLRCNCVVDVGANRGQFALVARHCLPEAEVHSFEPLNAPAQTFRRLFAKDRKVTLHTVAIGPARKEMPIHVSNRDDSSSLLPITNRQNELFPGTAKKGEETIRVETLSAVLQLREIISPALLKLDVQGFELEALKGCGDLLSRFQYVYVECSFVELYEGQAFADEVIRHLQERGFSLSGIYNPTYDNHGHAVQADFLFLRNSENGVLAVEDHKNNE